MMSPASISEWALARQMESAALAAWPALQEQVLQGWRLRFANGYTKRANSANASTEAAHLGPEQIDSVEAAYHQRGLPPIFRLTSLPESSQMDEALARRGYRLVDPSWVMAAALPNAPLQNESPANPQNVQADWRLVSDAQTWLHSFDDISGAKAASQVTHLQMLQAIDGPCAHALLGPQAQALSCGLGVMTHGLLGLFDIATRVDARRQGLARQVCKGLMAWGQQAGATHVYLQVLASNTQAMALYESLGMRCQYQYAYRVGGI